MKRNMNNYQCFKLISFILCLSMLFSISFPTNAQDDIPSLDAQNSQLTDTELFDSEALPNVSDNISNAVGNISLTSTSVTSYTSVYDFSELLSLPTVDGCIYSFKNIWTSRYASSTTDSTYANTHFNIFQQINNTSSAQSFRLDDAGNGYYYIIPLELNQTETRVMCAEPSIIEDIGDTKTNVTYAAYSTNSIYEFRWKIECYETKNGCSKFFIKLYEEDPDYDYLLTAYTNDDGNHNNTAIEGTSATGNIVLTKVSIFSSLGDKYLWQLESGNRQLHYGINLRTLSSHFDICMDILNTPYINCPVMNYGDTCSIGTSTNHVMTIDSTSFRVNPSLNPGYTTIMVVFRDSSGGYREIFQRGAYVYFTPGVHYISDITDNYVVTAMNSNPAQLTSYNGNEPTDDSKLFSFLYIGSGMYCLLTKTSGAYALGVSNNSLVVVGVGVLSDYSSIPTSCKWTITSTANGYRIYNYGSTNSSLTAPASITNGSLLTIASNTSQYWNIQRAYFLSGYELPYNTSYWNDPTLNYYNPDHIQYFVNCYSYAYNNQTQYRLSLVNGFYSIGAMQPGVIGGVFNRYAEEIGWYIQSKKHLLKLLGEDANATDGITFVKTTKYGICPVGTYKVALWYNTNNGDYHWYRQNSDGTWSHKPGRTPVTNLDSNGNPIIDPQYAATSYTSFIGFYYVVPYNVITPYSSVVYDAIPITSYYPDDYQ